MERLLHWVITVGSVALLCLTTSRSEMQAQDAMNRSRAGIIPECELAALDSDVVFFRGGSDFIVAFNQKNISPRPCVPRPFEASPQYDQNQLADVKPFGECMECEDRLPNGQYPVRQPIVLNPGEVAHQTYRWKTRAPVESIKCLGLNALFGPVLVVGPALLGQVCSEISVSRTYPGAFVPPSLQGEPLAEPVQRGEVFVLSSTKPRYYQGQTFTLHARLAEPTYEPLAGEECPKLFLRHRSPDGGTRFDAVLPTGFKTCGSFSLGADRNADWRSGIEVDSGVGRWTGVGEQSFELFQVVDSGPDGGVQFIRSNKLILLIDDPALIQRRWRGKAKGVGVDVTLDKDIYQLGEDVPLHIAIENFDAPMPVYAIDPIWDPSQAIAVAVRDASGHFLAETERFENYDIWTGHGRRPVPYVPGKIVTIERTLAIQGWLPNRPGTYTVVVTWNTLDGTKLQRESRVSRTEPPKTYATVQATASFRVRQKSSALQP